LGAPDETPVGSIDAQRPAPHPQTLLVTITGRINRADALPFAERVIDELVANRASLVICDVRGLVRPDAAAVDAICRIRVAARRFGARLRLRNASIDLVQLLDLMGLCDVLTVSAESGFQA